MKTRVFSAALAAAAIVVGSFGFSQHAMAVTFSEDTSTLPPVGQIIDPTVDISSQFGTVLTGLTGASVPGSYRSPFENFAAPHTIPGAYLTAPFTAIGATGVPSSATYDFGSAQTSLVALWGSPDAYNTLQFWSGLGGAGSLLATFTGSDLSIQGFGHDLVTFLAEGAETFQSVVLSSTGAAFEFAAVEQNAVPLPAALPLFGTGLGLLAYVGRRRKKRRTTGDLMPAV